MPYELTVIISKESPHTVHPKVAGSIPSEGHIPRFPVRFLVFLVGCIREATDGCFFLLLSKINLIFLKIRKIEKKRRHSIIRFV